MHSHELKEKAISLRKQGYSIKEIASMLNIAKSTSSTWLSNIILNPTAQEKLARKKILGQYKGVLIRKKTRLKNQALLEKSASEMLSHIPLSKELAKTYCALIWWCEGNKKTNSLKFTNSDTTLISNFLYLLRLGFNINESKLRALVHIHEYHDDSVQKKFWSQITKIPLSQFHRSYKKPNTGKRYRENYPGCIVIVYYDSSVAKELEAIYNVFSKQRGVR